MMRKILLAVSGGIDSMYMANRASELIPGACFAIAHCNFCLRGEESDEDERFVREWSGRKGLTCHVRRFDTTAYASRKGISIEMAARELRYGWFEELCTEHGYEAVALAHNANDNAETLMLNLLRGTGSRGVRGMSGRPGIIRPLLGTERHEIESWMKENGCDWREDRTNAESLYKRNLIRNEVFPLLARINPSFVKTLNEDMRRLAQVDDIAEEFYLSAKERLCNEDGDIEIKALLAERHWRFLLWRLLEDRGIGRQEFESLCELLESGRQLSGKAFGPVRVSSSHLSTRSEASFRRELHWKLLDRKSLTSLRAPEGVLYADADKLAWPLKIRSWQEGDWMQPLGMKGRKKLSDMFVDLKWTGARKSGAQVIELEGSHVAALLCQRIDESVKIDDKSSRVLVLSYSSEIM